MQTFRRSHKPGRSWPPWENDAEVQAFHFEAARPARAEPIESNPFPVPPPSQKFVTVHGHFYQPPRENPWLEIVEAQDSAAPFHDWNERITHECYAPNGQARLLNERKKIARIVNNYARMSFNFGPTLLSWLEKNAPRVYRSILAADREGAQRFGGHGPAMAQVYNHIIMPLADKRDRTTQIVWGIADFERRFARKPEGMWLAETAVDHDTLDLLAQHGIRFVVLAPLQCKHVRSITPGGNAAWRAVTPETLDTRIAFRVPLKDGRSIAAFFYDGRISQAVAFEGLLGSGDKFAARLMGGFSEAASAAPQLVHIATDGESYGHHHRHGEMALAYALDKIEREGQARPTVYGEFLELPRRNTRPKSTTKAPGAAFMASNAGAPTAAAQASSRDGTSSGALRCATRSTACAMPWRPSRAHSRGICCMTSTPRATPTSPSSSTARRPMLTAFSPPTRWPRSTASSRPKSCA